MIPLHFFLLLFALPTTIIRPEYDDSPIEPINASLRCIRTGLRFYQALAQERLEGYRLHVEQSREEIDALQVIRVLFFSAYFSSAVALPLRGRVTALVNIGIVCVSHVFPY